MRHSLDLTNCRNRPAFLISNFGETNGTAKIEKIALCPNESKNLFQPSLRFNLFKHVIHKITHGELNRMNALFLRRSSFATARSKRVMPARGTGIGARAKVAR